MSGVEWMFGLVIRELFLECLGGEGVVALERVKGLIGKDMTKARSPESEGNYQTTNMMSIASNCNI